MIWIRISDPQMNQQILYQCRLVGFFDATWSKRSQVTDPDLDYPNGMHFKSLSKSICAVFGQLWDLYFTLTLFFLSPDLIGANDVVHVLDVFRVSGLSPHVKMWKFFLISYAPNNY